jgi:3-hydroxyisobutyrate dehydrogenase
MATIGLAGLDAPVSGGVAGARSGSPTIMADGPADVLDRVRPVLEVLGSHVVHAGTIAGAGHAIKALNNLMSATHLMLKDMRIALQLEQDAGVPAPLGQAAVSAWAAAAEDLPAAADHTEIARWLSDRIDQSGES